MSLSFETLKPSSLFPSSLTRLATHSLHSILPRHLFKASRHGFSSRYPTKASDAVLGSRAKNSCSYIPYTHALEHLCIPHRAGAAAIATEAAAEEETVMAAAAAEIVMEVAAAARAAAVCGPLPPLQHSTAQPPLLPLLPVARRRPCLQTGKAADVDGACRQWAAADGGPPSPKVVMPCRWLWVLRCVRACLRPASFRRRANRSNGGVAFPPSRLTTRLGGLSQWRSRLLLSPFGVSDSLSLVCSVRRVRSVV